MKAQIPRATYRLQFTKDFGFRDAATLAPYLAKLGVSHVYASPYLRARPGSTHGYDIVSHTELNPELGDAASFAAMNAAFRENGLGQILDFVPNHMGVGGADNSWWLDVLEWGPASEFAGWFDIDWEPDRRYLQNKVLVPFLGEQYGAVLEAGGLELKFDTDAGTLSVWAYDTHKLPVCPPHYARILGDRHPGLEALADAFGHLSAGGLHAAARARGLKAELADGVRTDPEWYAAIRFAVARFKGQIGDIESWERLDGLIRDQHWRPAYFRVAADDINYRRFFNINDLAGIRMETPEVFDHAHSLVFALLRDGILDGLRLDHVDGLLDPKAYCLRLREKAPRPFYLIVEKILAPHERVRDEWRVEGTTGYEFANLVTGLLIHPAGEEPLTRFYREFTGDHREFAAIVRDAKMYIMENEMASELNVLAREAARVARSNPRTADFTNNVLQRALKNTIACFPVYRTYVDGGSTAGKADRRDIEWAVSHARRLDPALDPSVFDFLQDLLTCDLVARPRSGFSRVAVARVAMRAQQYSGPVMAKGLEDTAFYRYNRMLALNEVGGHPDKFCVNLAAFHHANLERARHTPHAMLSTSTHDTKRGEDTRARLAVLSEAADNWSREVKVWSRMLRGSEEKTSRDSLDSSDEYVFYQLLFGAWPADLSVSDGEGIAALRTRLEGAMVKAMREAKTHTTWASPNAAYEGAVLSFMGKALDASRANPFLDSFSSFLARYAPFGMRNSLVQTVLKMTVPGTPDIYQGAELWDLSLVDPDNRRPVDFQARAALVNRDRTTKLTELLENWQDGRIKLQLISDLLQLRRQHPNLFLGAGYTPLHATGVAAERICAFVRQNSEVAIIVAASLYPTMANGEWGETTSLAPPEQQEAGWFSLFDQSPIVLINGILRPADLFKVLPVAVLVRTAHP
jgi:(1->4)-alpha-D-glucan 1-alpha-D-glucosylmutase